MSAYIETLTEDFFKHVATDEFDVDQIKARGDMAKAEAEAKQA